MFQLEAIDLWRSRATLLKSFGISNFHNDVSRLSILVQFRIESNHAVALFALTHQRFVSFGDLFELGFVDRCLRVRTRTLQIRVRFLGHRVVGLFNLPEAGRPLDTQNAVVVFGDGRRLLEPLGRGLRRLNVFEFGLRGCRRHTTDVPNQTGTELEFVDHGWRGAVVSVGRQKVVFGSNFDDRLCR